ncbi:MAG: glycerophosphodiester phosphodiesterase [Rhodospirillales bacterium]|nr:glycerophosphodiester phosphodiesterase [Rhodospirillales bacterium]MBO6785743.1 glycerophosphodiester phosphodiesterase [Rhodospirillales bacterium]
MSINVSGVPFVIGHRGAAGLAPENTLISLRRARLEGAKWVEFDVKLSSDGTAVLFHDDTLERTTTGRGRVKDCHIDTIRKLEAGAWFGASFAGTRVPTFAESIQTLADEGLGANVEIKPCPGEARRTAEVVCRMIAETWSDSVPGPVISSFDRDAMAVARDMLPDAARAMLFSGLPDDWKRVVDELKCTSVHASNRHVTKAVVAQVNEAGLPLRIYTVNDPARAETLREWGVSAVFTDRPDLIKD